MLSSARLIHLIYILLIVTCASNGILQSFRDYCVGKNLDFYDVCSRENMRLIQISAEKAQKQARKEEIARKRNRLRDEKFLQKLRELFF